LSNIFIAGCSAATMKSMQQRDAEPLIGTICLPHDGAGLEPEGFFISRTIGALFRKAYREGMLHGGREWADG
jgi:hypothetical protein